DEARVVRIDPRDHRRAEPRPAEGSEPGDRRDREQPPRARRGTTLRARDRPTARAHRAASIFVTVYVLPAFSAANLTLSPAFRPSSIAALRTRNTIVIGGMSSVRISPCFSVSLPLARSTLRT